MTDPPDDPVHLQADAAAQAVEHRLAGTSDRRRRTTRRTRAAVATCPAVVGLVLGGCSAVDPASAGRTPAPSSATSSPVGTPTPGSSAAPDPLTLPAGDPALPFGACGSVVGSPTAYQATSALAPFAELSTPTVRAGSPLPVVAGTTWAGQWPEYEAPPEYETGAVPSHGPRFLVTRGDVVVAVDDAYGGQHTAWDVYSAGRVEPSTRYTAAVDLVVCEEGADGPGATAGSRPLPAGDYALHTLAEVVPLGPVADWGSGVPDLSPAEIDGMAPAAAVGEPVAFSITGSAEQVADAPVPGELDRLGSVLSTYASCGMPAPEPAPSAPVLTLDVQAPARTVAAGEDVSVEAELTYGGPGRIRLQAFDLEAWAVQDGVVVGMTHSYVDLSAIRDLGTGVPLPVSTAWGPAACVDGDIQAFDGPRLGPGEYDLYVGTVLVGDPLVLDGGEVPPTADTDEERAPYGVIETDVDQPVLLRGPFPLTVG